MGVNIIWTKTTSLKRDYYMTLMDALFVAGITQLLDIVKLFLVFCAFEYLKKWWTKRKESKK